MNPDTMLAILSEHGEEAGSDYNDADQVMGYFGWSVSGDVLTVTYEPENNPDYPESAVHRWRLVPIPPDGA